MSTRSELALTYYNPETWGQMKAMAEVLVRSGALPKDVKNAEQCMIKMQTGLEMGMSPMQSMQELYIVNGQVNVWGKGLVRRMKEHGWDVEYNYDYKGDDVSACTVVVSKRLEPNTVGNLSKVTKREYSQKFTYEMAEKSGYTKSRNGEFKPGWLLGANLELKLGYNALGMIIKKYLPEVLGSATGIAELADQDIQEPVEAVEVVVKEEEPVDTAKEVKAKKKAVKVTKTAREVENLQDERLKTKQKEFFALVNEIGGEAEAFKEKIKDKYWPRDAQGNKVGEFSFNDLNEIQLLSAINVLRSEISKKKMS